MRNTYKAVILFVLLAPMSSCNDYLDVNQNQNSLVKVPSGLLLLKGTLLANAQIQQGQLVRAAMYYTGGLRGVRLVQQTMYEYNYTPGDSDPTWGYVYNGILLQNKEIRRLSPSSDLLQGVIDVNEALALGTLTSLFGDIPDLTAVPDNPTLESKDPEFDAQAGVYSRLQTLLDGAILKIQESKLSASSISDEDIYYRGDKNKWIEAANTLKARYYLQTKQYTEALAVVDKGISSAGNTMSYHPIGEVPGNSNLLYIFVNSSRGGDMTGDGTFFRDLLDTSKVTSRNNSKTDETARRKYLYIDGDGDQPNGIDGPATPMKLVNYEENMLIWAECLQRAGDIDGAIGKLNELRAYLNSGNAFNLIDKDDTPKYEAFVSADFEAGGIENLDGIDTDKAVLREIIEERYVSGFYSYMPFNDARRLLKSDKDVMVPFPLNDDKTTVTPQRFLYPQSEINANSNIPDPIPDLFTPTPVNQ